MGFIEQDDQRKLLEPAVSRQVEKVSANSIGHKLAGVVFEPTSPRFE
jgi:hypothetical protein